MRVLVVLMVVVTMLAACGDDGSSTTAAQPTTGDDVQSSPSGVQVTGGMDAAPEITIPDSEPPAELEIVDLVEGDGDEVAEGATVTAQYVGKSWSTGVQFDSSWERGQPATFPLGNVVQGWSQGLPGMRVGGRRLLVIPPELGYGDQSPTPDIQPGETLVFVVDMVSTQ